MQLLRIKRRTESWEQVRARMLAETAQFISECLRHPELAVRIPTIPAGSGRFPPSLTAAFWEPLLIE
ncbi:MAG: hypothetical protein U1D55_09110 [Phycisphaerae bacterium]